MIDRWHRFERWAVYRATVLQVILMALLIGMLIASPVIYVLAMHERLDANCRALYGGGAYGEGWFFGPEVCVERHFHYYTRRER